MRIFEFENYREFIQFQIKSQPKMGRGQLLRIAKHIGIHTTTMSQILGGSREMSLEQAVLATDYFGLSPLETRYFLLLVQLERAASEKLRALFREQLEELKGMGNELVHVVPPDKVLSKDEKATFYSNWFYSAARVLSSIPGFQTREALTTRLGLPKRLVTEIIYFLVNSGLCVETAAGLAPAAKYTHLESASPLVSRHHGNWRIKAMERHPSLLSTDLAYSSPMSISANDALKVRQMLIDLVEKVNAIREPSPCEKAYCLNLDWFEF